MYLEWVGTRMVLFNILDLVLDKLAYKPILDSQIYNSITLDPPSQPGQIRQEVGKSRLVLQGSRQCQCEWPGRRC